MADFQTAGQELSLELVQQVLVEGLVSLAGDEYRMRSIFRRPDTLPRGLNNKAEDAVNDMLDIVRNAAHVGTHRDGTGLSFSVNFPASGEQWPSPLLTVTWASGSEDAGSAYAGDVVGTRDVVHGSDLNTCKVYREISRGCLKRQSILLSIYSLRPEEARVLHMAFSHIVQRDKWRLMVGGVKDVTISEMGREPDETAPHVQMLPMLTLNILLLQSSSELIGPVTCRVSFDDWFVST